MRATIVRADRTRSLSSTSVYSDRISSVRSHTNVGASVHAAISAALGLSDGSSRNPETPATRTDVSTTLLGGCFHRFGDNRQLRLPAFTTIRLDGSCNVRLGNAPEISGALFESRTQFLFPARSLATTRQVACLFCEGHPFVQFGDEPSQRNQNRKRLFIPSSRLDAYCLDLT